ncbi:TPA: phage baseplate protein [Citrobacter braakii]|uniref:phage baseplate protein n=1 Tax=Citrobacter braakii TaxID=57706 RepID=UPI0015EA43A2|nr:phage baseplate protein [Citrobacter braakii]MBJ8954445.1 phage baseplate protein [Citrobacter braakii]QLX27700.1 phage baseplate protein [Citrobacter freundii]HEE9910231.1 phage baseplate protein [Citrobacter braakii]
MRPASQITAIVEQILNSALFALEAKIISVKGGKATVKPTPKRAFPDNENAVSYAEVENVRLVSLVWDGGKSGVSGRVKPGDECLLIALSHGDDDEPDHKTLSSAVAICGFSDVAAHQMPDGAGLRAFSGSAFIEWDDNHIKAATGGGAEIVMDGDKINFIAPGGHDFTGVARFRDDVTMDKGLKQGESSGAKAEFGGDVDIAGISKAADHDSGGKSGKTHKHRENGQGNLTDEPS